MNRIEDFSAKLIFPEIFREICSIISNVSKTCSINTRRAGEEGEAEEEDELVMCAANQQNSFQIWVHLSSQTMFDEFRLVNPEWVEVKADSLAHAFRNEAGIVGMNEVRMRISHKPSRQHSTNASSGSQVVPQSARLISFTMNNKSVDSLATKAIEQRIYAEILEREAAASEPSLAGIKFWADPTVTQLNQMAKVCEQYRQLGDTVRVTVTKAGIFKLVSDAAEVIANTSWRLDLAERADELEADEDSGDNDDESLFVDEPKSQCNQSTQASISRKPGARKNEETCVVLAKDWSTVLQARRICRRLVIGVLSSGGLVAYGFLKQGRNSSTQDVVTFYLWHQGV